MVDTDPDSVRYLRRAIDFLSAGRLIMFMATCICGKNELVLVKISHEQGLGTASFHEKYSYACPSCGATYNL